MEFQSARVTEILGFAEAAARFEPGPNSRMEEAVRDGLPKSALVRVARLIETEPVLANELVFSVVPKSSLARRDILTPEQSEKTERLARLFAMAETVLGGEEEARVFLHRAHPLLNGRRPLDAASTELGGRAVERVLQSVEFGLPV